MSRFDNTIKIGRIAFINNEDCLGKLVAVVDVVNTNRIIVEGIDPEISRQAINIKALEFLPFEISIKRGDSKEAVESAAKEAEIVAKWHKHPAFNRIERAEKRRNMNDFDRFVVMSLQKQRSRILNKCLKEMKA